MITRPIFSFDSAAYIGTLTALGSAFLAGGLIGLERQFRQRTAGLRTNVLVAVGAAAFVDLGGRLMGADGASQIIAYVVSGVGFLGAGVIIKEGAQIRGLNTAATLWASAAVGAFAGAGLLVETATVTAFVLAGNTLLRPLVDAINRRPLDEPSTEATYRVHLLCAPAEVSEARDALAEQLEAADNPVQEIETLSEGEDLVELAAVLAATSADPEVLDGVVAALEKLPFVESATWTVSVTS
jgi:putative Mg2+ transporter-C (MgtC) family protein